MKRAFLIYGSPRSGKDTFVNFCKTYDEDILNFSSVDYIKWLCHKQLDIDVNNKTPELRKFLSDFKKILSEYNDYPAQQCIKAIETLEPNQSIFIHVREKSEMDKIKSAFPETKIVMVTNNQNEVEKSYFGNDSDDKIKEIHPDIVIFNDSTLEELSKTARWFVQTQIEDKKYECA